LINEKEVRDAVIKSGGKIYDLKKPEQQAYLKQAYEVWPEGEKPQDSRKSINRCLEKYREK